MNNTNETSKPAASPANLHRPKAEALPALIFIALLAAASAANILLPQKDFSPMENRNLALFPPVSAQQLHTGKWMEDFERYASDQFLFRDEFMKIKTAADLALQQKDNGRVYFGKDGYLFAIDSIDTKQENTALTLTGDFISRVKARYPELHAAVLLAPTAQTVLADKLPAHAPVSDQQTALKLAEDYLRLRSPSAVFTNPLDALTDAARRDPSAAASESDSRQIYYRTDHHWTADGAYAAYRKWAGDNGFTPVDSSSFLRQVVSDDFYGTNQSKAPGLTLPADRIIRYVPKDRPDKYTVTAWPDITKPDKTEIRGSLYDERFLEGKDQYGYFLGGNDPQLRIETPVKNERRLLLIKDSYANSMVPFLALHYEELYITDLRYSHGKLILPQPTDGGEPFTDVMFLYNIESFCSDRNLAYLTQLSF